MIKEYRQLSYNISARTAPISYLVVHDTGNTAKTADAKAHFSYFQGGNRNSSADIFVDDGSAWYVNDYTKFYSWHCGDGNGKYGITNKNSIGIELCINQDGDYTQTLKNAVQVIKELMKELNIPLDRVVRHYDASRKICPGTMSANNWQRWKEFQAMLAQEDTPTPTPAPAETPTVYHAIDDTLPAWTRDAVQWAVDTKLIQGDGNSLALTEDKLWGLVVLYRLHHLA